ncbi:ABC transporter ATP-binding protein [Agrobacterium sp. ICMP 6402]|uniref:ABC transporter ATP-binding protein n=1 Tax=Agrobacterium sp. ICMP 6402 TaxID=2292443 RepID=UPI0018864A1D|nr:ABC transporter ATP-binding protein [Agrobacterium sp. ICMP 6402]
MAETPRPSRANMLEVLGASLFYGNVKALDNVSVVAGEGEFLTILGESGSGKTTLLKIISGLETPSDAQALRIGGQDVRDLGASDRNCTTVFQHYALFPHMSVRENVEYGLKVRGVSRDERRKQAIDALEMVRLAHKADRLITQLSGGERQRIALARAFVTKPAILLLDEPLGALDEKLRVDMQEELIAIQRNLGITFVYITHSQEEALTMSDRILLMRNGKIAQEGAPTDLFDRPNSGFTARFMGVDNVFDGEIIATDGISVSLSVGGQTLEGQWSGTSAPVIGKNAVLGVRAERVRLDPQERLENVLDATLQTSVYKGKYLDIAFNTSVGSARARLWDSDQAPTGVRRIGWSKSSCTVMDP